jgi:hypothetical protein
MKRLRLCLLTAAVVLLFATQLPIFTDSVSHRDPVTANRAPTHGSLASIFKSLLATQVAYADTVTGSATYALPQLAFGEGWYTALYFSNDTDAAASVQVKFYAPDGSPLSVPLPGYGTLSTVNANINPKGTVILEAPDAGTLRQGWSEATLPAGVTGYGVFRQSVPGSTPQEAVVPLSLQSKQSADLTWDEVGFTTAVALVNPSSTAAVVNVVVFGDDGATIGTASVNLAPMSRTAIVLRNQPGLSGMAGKRGVARFSTSAGAVAALGLRFGAAAFTSIPVFYP